MNKALTISVLLVALAGLCWAFPPFRMRSLRAVQTAQTNAQFNAGEFAHRFWSEDLLPVAAQAAEVKEVLRAAAAGRGKVREQFGRTVGIGSSYFLFVRGAGRVVSVSEENIGLAVSSTASTEEVCVPLGLVFGNAVRDATGLLKASNYPNAQEFNDISAALNSMVETNVLPQLQQMATTGKVIRFVGCVEITDEEQDLKPLKVVPILIMPE